MPLRLLIVPLAVGSSVPAVAVGVFAGLIAFSLPCVPVKGSKR